MISQETLLANEQPVTIFSMTNALGSKLQVTNLGATILSFEVADQFNQKRDIVLGYEPVDRYFSNNATYFGATVGRSANRINQASFTLNDKVYNLPKNEGENNLHSGPNGYHLRLWDIIEVNQEQNSVTLEIKSPDSDQGYPGNLTLVVIYQLTDQNELIITYNGLSDADTIFNPTNHSYFNLNGHNSGTIEEHLLQLNCHAYTPISDSKSIPTGEMISVENTPFDFTTQKRIGQDIDAAFDQIQYAGGYDHNLIITEPSLNKPFATAIGNESGIKMEVYTDLPGVQFYSGNFIEKENGKAGTIYTKRSGFCLETQFFPNAINTPQFEAPVLLANTPYQTTTIYQFDIKK
ncbi:MULTISPECIES: aldose epimerase family protein [Streptococcus]|uniref:Aldose 1-epimerase n=1 Tax=Streptococcus caledonicus TaxID=2614158 RepID=A0ABW0UJS2_9STRE|nr:aldose epimerase family protein [Streptococcus sp. S784/96/1]